MSRWSSARGLMGRSSGGRAKAEETVAKMMSSTSSSGISSGSVTQRARSPRQLPILKGYPGNMRNAPSYGSSMGGTGSATNRIGSGTYHIATGGKKAAPAAVAATAVAADVKKNRHYLRKGAIGVGVAGAGTAGYGYIKHRGSQNKSITNNPNGIYG